MNEISLPTLDYCFPAISPNGHRTFVAVVGVTENGGVVFVHGNSEGRGWELPGGLVEAGESALTAAVREFYEETGWHLLSPGEVAVIQNHCVDGTPHSKVALVAGWVVPDETPFKDSEVSQRAVYSTVPAQTTFDRNWMSRLMEIAKDGLGRALNRKLWEEVASNYDDQTSISENEVHYGPLIYGESHFRLLPSLDGCRVLDLGCGAGHNLAALFKSGAREGVGVDFCQEQLRRARVRLAGNHCDLIQGDVSMVDFSDLGKFDLIISVFAISFVADAKGLFKKSAQSLKPGGTLIISTDHPVRLGRWNGNNLQIDDWFNGRHRQRIWATPTQCQIPYAHYLHDLQSLTDAISESGLFIERILEPQAVPLTELAHVPYHSHYFTGRYKELRRIPYSLVLKVRAPGAANDVRA